MREVDVKGLVCGWRVMSVERGDGTRCLTIMGRCYVDLSENKKRAKKGKKTSAEMDVVFLIRRSIACCGGPPNDLDVFCTH